jgi:hypothetical protein
MRGFWLFVHISGFIFWLGGGIATMVAGISAKSFAPAERLAVYRVISAVQRILVGTGAAAVILSGFLLSMAFMSSGIVPGWLMLMMTAGLVGAIAALAISVPTAARLGRLELDPRGDLPEAFHKLRKRQIFAASVAGGLGIVALLATTIFRR